MDKPKPLNILLVDDQPDFVETIAFWMKSKGYAVISASSGEEALRLLQSNPAIDIIFLDVHMPHMDGIKTLSKIRELNPRIPVILLTAYPEEAITAKAKELGISGFFTKEGNFEKLTDVIEVALRMHKKIQLP